jgi:S-adenosylmethionine hydrolase
MPRPAPIVTLLTDFGAADHFAAAMKGVILSRCPAARIVDVTHEAQAYEIEQARFLLAQSWPYFPKGSIHVVVVDPGVGTARRAILVEAGGHRFLAPDNGLLTDLLHLPKARVRSLENRKLFRAEVSSTFHGRDIFASVAGHLAAGAPPARVGPLIHNAHLLGTGPAVRTGKRDWSGTVIHVDRFGNLITNLRPADIPDLAERTPIVRAGLVTLTGFAANYAAIPPGACGIIMGSHGGLEIAACQAPAAKLLGLALGSPVDLELS